MTEDLEVVISRLRSIADSSMTRVEKARAVAQAIKLARNHRWVGLYDVTPTEIVAIAWTGSDPPAYPSFPVTSGLNGAAVATREPVIVQDVRTDPRYLTAFASTRAEAIFPVELDGRIVGTIDVESDRVNAFGPGDEEFLKSCAQVVARLWI
jgi:putative methionine-R-sulfoxide reductase with GAF domain